MADDVGYFGPGSVRLRSSRPGWVTRLAEAPVIRQVGQHAFDQQEQVGAVMMTADALLELAGYTTRNHTGETNTTLRQPAPWYSENSLPPAAPTTTPRPAQATAGDPYLAVSYVYRAIANGSATGCALFSPTAAQQFATDFGAPDCPSAIDKLTTLVTGAIAYALTGQRSPDVYLGDTMTISSCEITPEGGPLLGRFILQRTNDRGYITGHEAEKC